VEPDAGLRPRREWRSWRCIVWQRDEFASSHCHPRGSGQGIVSLN
jgi:hypothetical protein